MEAQPGVWLALLKARMRYWPRAGGRTKTIWLFLPRNYHNPEEMNKCNQVGFPSLPALQPREREAALICL